MINDTPLWNAAAPTKFECHAAFPGTGPTGEICSRCALLEPEKNRFICGKYKQLVGRKGKPISPNSFACRYFEKRRAFNTSESTMNERRPGYNDGIREMGRRAAENGAPLARIDENDMLGHADRELWREGWRLGREG